MSWATSPLSPTNRYKLFKSDTALCVRSRDHMMVIPLHQLMGVVSYSFSRSSHEHSVEVYTAPSAVAFQHKVPDAISIPLMWFLLGPTLRNYLEERCALSGCDVSTSAYEIGVAPLREVVWSFLRSTRRLRLRAAESTSMRCRTPSKGDPIKIIKGHLDELKKERGKASHLVEHMSIVEG